VVLQFWGLGVELTPHLKKQNLLRNVTKGLGLGRWTSHVAQIGEKRNAYKILLGKPEGQRPLGRPRHRCVDNIKMDLREIEWGGMDWIELAQDRDQWRTLVNLRVP
jgi:hypothetical protein